MYSVYSQQKQIGQDLVLKTSCFYCKANKGLNCDQREIFAIDFIDVFNYSMQKYFKKLKKITPKNRPRS